MKADKSIIKLICKKKQFCTK